MGLLFLIFACVISFSQCKAVSVTIANPVSFLISEIMMDVHHLEVDELEVEFNVRKLDPKGESALGELARV